MRRTSRLVALSTAALLAGGLAACSSSSAGDEESSGDFEAITIEHALGTTTIESKPERVATVHWANHEVPLALGVVPVGMAAANFGDDDGDGLLPWVSERLEELDAEVPVLFDETDGIDFEAVADTNPDVILAGYSGLTQEDYDTLSEIAPVVAYPEAPWATPWREMIEINAAGMGMAEEGEELVASLEQDIADAVGRVPAARGQGDDVPDARGHHRPERGQLLHRRSTPAAPSSRTSGSRPPRASRRPPPTRSSSRAR